jgi:UDP-N-acetylmuramyl pentapeptide phosphotransferase/UDP-N-acetylglucosamine-1-phosphate transferase
MVSLFAIASLQEKLLVVVALVSWLFCAITVIQSRWEIRTNSKHAEQAKKAGLEAVIVAPDALTAKGRRLRVRLIAFAVIFVISVILLAWLLARPKTP